MQVIGERAGKAIPRSLIRLAVGRFCGGVLVGKSRSVERMRGQMMGDYLSFPFLCLTNWLTAKMTLGSESTSVIINGDDIAFKASSEGRERWMEGVASGGLTLSKGKTLVSSWCVSLNSMFWTDRGGSLVKEGRVIRPKTFTRGSVDGLLNRWWEVVKGWKGGRRNKISRAFLNWSAKMKNKEWKVPEGMRELIKNPKRFGDMVPGPWRNKIAQRIEDDWVLKPAVRKIEYAPDDPRSLYEMRALGKGERGESVKIFEWTGLYYGRRYKTSTVHGVGYALPAPVKLRGGLSGRWKRRVVLKKSINSQKERKGWVMREDELWKCSLEWRSAFAAPNERWEVGKSII
uniref:Putative RdRp n=1 Tax=Leucocoprinus ourmiavirus C TaxID=2592721 RepID=A0A7G3KH54_9VIRU|nr:putative RdRp [Leucocoprinus ourmiavirus C]